MEAKHGKKEESKFLDATTNKFTYEQLKKETPAGVNPAAK